MDYLERKKIKHHENQTQWTGVAQQFAAQQRKDLTALNVLMTPIDSFITTTTKLFSTITLIGLLAGCTTPMAGRKDPNDAQSKALRHTDSDSDDGNEISPDERPF